MFWLSWNETYYFPSSQQKLPNHLQDGLCSGWREKRETNSRRNHQEPLVDVSHCPSVHSGINPDLKEQLQPAPYGSLPSALPGLLWGFDIGWGKGEAVQSVFLGMNSQLTWKDKKWVSDLGKVFSSSPVWNLGAHSNCVTEIAKGPAINEILKIYI